MAGVALPDLTARIRVDTSDLDKVGKEGEKAGSRLGSGLKAGAAVAGAALGAFALKGLKGAVDLEQAVGGVETVFGKSAKTVLELGENAAESVGLAKDEYATLAAVVGSQLQRLGQSQEESAVSTDKLISLGADLAATYGGSVSEAVSAVGALLRGEADPIERYGVGIKEIDVAAKLAANGQDKLTGASLEQAKGQAKLAVLFEQTRKTQGAFGRESETAAGQQAILEARVRNLQLEFGNKLLPVLNQGLGKLGELADFVQRNQAVIVPLVAVLGTLAAGVVVVNSAVKAYTAVQAALNVVLAANPIGLVVLAIAALVGGLVLAYNKSETFRDIVNGALAAVKTAFVGLATGALGVIDKLLAGYQAMATAAGKLPGPLGAPFRAAADAIGVARAGVQALTTKINEVPKSKTAQVAANVKGADDVRSMRRAIDSVNSKTVFLTTVLKTENQRDATKARNAAFGGGRATGGPVMPNRAYLVGEEGPELVVPRSAATVLTAKQTLAARAGSQGSAAGFGTEDLLLMATQQQNDLLRKQNQILERMPRDYQMGLRQGLYEGLF